MRHAEAVLEPVVHSSGKDKVRVPQLFEVTQTLKVRGVDESHELALQQNLTVHARVRHSRADR